MFGFAPEEQHVRFLLRRSNMFWFCSGGATCFGFAPEEQHVYSLTNPNTCALQRSAMCALARSVYMPLLTERDSLGIWSYKHVAPPEQTEHVAPPEQEPNMLLLRSKTKTCCSSGARTLDTE
jgi:hypothetical protein